MIEIIRTNSENPNFIKLVQLLNSDLAKEMEILILYLNLILLPI